MANTHHSSLDKASSAQIEELQLALILALRFARELLDAIEGNLLVEDQRTLCLHRAHQTFLNQVEFADRLVAINRVSKTVKGGKRFGFAALVVVGDQKGRVGFGKGKAKEVPEAIRKATESAKRNMIRVPLREGRTLHHDMNGRWGAGKVVMRTAPEGTGIIAGGPMRAVFEMLGIKDVVSKSIGSQNPYNMIRATLNGLQKEQSPRNVAQRRGKKVADILPKREDAAQASAQVAEEA